MKSLAIAMTTLTLATLTAGAQQTERPLDETLSTCAALAESGKANEAAAVAKGVEPEFRKLVASDPRSAEPRVALARLLSQCLVPSAGFMQQGELSGEALELLDQALEIKPDHWLARFVLASISDRSPAFLGRGKRAAKEYDTLLEMQGDRNDNPMFARVFAARGRQLSRDGQADSAKAIWARGLRLFPNDRDLIKLNESVAKPQSAAPPVLTAVKVVASAAPKISAPSVKSVSRTDVLLTAGGAADVFQTVQMQPGATRVNEGGDVYTRGGDASETALVVNGGRLTSLGRFEGLSGSLFGALEPFVIKSVRFWSGGFSVRHGNSLSGVLEIETDGKPREMQKRFGVSLVQASGTIRSPVTSKSGGWVSARFSHTGALLRTHGRTDEFAGAPRSAEAIGTFVINPTPLTEIGATVIAESDVSRRNLAAAGWRGTFDSHGNKTAIVLRSRWISQSAPLVVKANLTGSTRSSDWQFGVLSRDRVERNGVLRVDAEWEPSSGTLVRTGIEQGLFSRTDDGTIPTTASVASDAPFAQLDRTNDNTQSRGVYVEGEKTVGRVSITSGLRADRLPGETSVTLDPRIALSVQNGKWTSRLSTGLFHQGRWRADAAIPDAGTPSGLPRVARHLVFGVERNGDGSLFKAETFVKSYDDYRAFGAGPEITSGISRGLELLGQRAFGKTTGWLGYSLLDAESELANGSRARSAFDVTHSLTASMTTSIARDWSVGTTARYGTGAPYTPVLGGRLESNGRTTPIYGELMGARLPSYSRVDARVMRYVRARSFLLTTFAEILNVTGRRNVSSYAYDAGYARREPIHSFFSQRTIVIGGEVMLK